MLVIFIPEFFLCSCVQTGNVAFRAFELLENIDLSGVEYEHPRIRPFCMRLNGLNAQLLDFTLHAHAPLIFSFKTFYDTAIRAA